MKTAATKKARAIRRSLARMSFRRSLGEIESCDEELLEDEVPVP